MGRKESVSVVMGTYNGQLWVVEQITSILAQIAHNDELIICDDCSTDDTVACINELDVARIRMSVNKERLGAWKNIVQTFDYIQHEYVLFADQDDIWLPGKVAMMQAHLAQPHCSVVMHDAEVIDAQGKILFQSYYKARGVRHGILRNALQNGYTGCFMACTTKFLKSISLFPEHIPYDQWIGLHAEVGQESFFESTPYVQWRRHTSNVTSPFVSPPLPPFQLFQRQMKTAFSILKVLATLSLWYLKDSMKKRFSFMVKSKILW